MQLSNHEEKKYRQACKELIEYDKLTEDKKKIPTVDQKHRANLMIKTFGDGLKNGDKFFRQSTSENLTTLLTIIQALRDDDLILMPLKEKYDGVGG